VIVERFPTCVNCREPFDPEEIPYAYSLGKLRPSKFCSTACRNEWREGMREHAAYLGSDR